MEEEAEGLQEPEEIENINKIRTSGLNRTGVHMNPPRLWLHVEILHRFKLEDVPSTERNGHKPPYLTQKLALPPLFIIGPLHCILWLQVLHF